MGCFPHARPPEPEVYAGALSAVLAQYPLGLVHECVDPRLGLAREREFPPTVNSVVEWCDKRLKHHQLMASYMPALPKPKEPDYSDEHRQGMLARLSDLMHNLFDAKKHQRWIRPRGVFELPDEHLRERRPSPDREQPVRKSWRPYTTEELREMYARKPAPQEPAA